MGSISNAFSFAGQYEGYQTTVLAEIFGRYSNKCACHNCYVIHIDIIIIRINWGMVQPKSPHLVWVRQPYSLEILNKLQQNINNGLIKNTATKT